MKKIEDAWFVLQVYGARAGKCAGKLVMADHRIIDSQKIPYMKADKCQVKYGKNPGVMSAFTSLWS
jgi:hypothetical protein